MSSLLALRARCSELTLLDILGIGAVIVDPEGMVIDQNSCAAPHLNEKFPSHDRRLTVADREANTALRATLAEAARRSGGKDLIVVSHARNAPSIIRSIPLAPDHSGRGNVLLIIVDLESTIAPSLESLAEIFRLTRAEARVATRLTAGDTLSQIARATNLSIGTVRAQLKSIFVKTGTHRQAELVCLLSRLARIVAARTTILPTREYGASFYPTARSMTKETLEGALRLRSQN